MVASASGESSTALTSQGRACLGLVELEEDPAHAVEVGGVLGFHLAGLFDVRAGLGEVFAPVGPHEAQVVEGLGVVRLHVNALLQIVLGPLVEVGALAGGADLEIELTVQPGRVVGAGQVLGGGKVANGFGKILELEVDQAR